ncbi:MAG: DEAD/DEAH box helicase, partial [Phycisphaerales bacterium]
MPDRIPRPEELPEGSAARARLARRPDVTYPPDLPVAQARAVSLRALDASPVVVVAGETGSGKTTQMPKICLEAGRGIHGTITLTQPRRIAARSVAARLADELGVRLGDLVGFKVRFDDRSGSNPLVRVVTDGVLLSELERDPDARRSDTIIIDEAHERSLNVDFLLGCMRRILARRPDLKLIVASATIDVRRFSEHFGGAPVVEVGGRLHPIEVRWRPDPEDAERGLVDRVLHGIEECVRE